MNVKTLTVVICVIMLKLTAFSQVSSVLYVSALKPLVVRTLQLNYEFNYGFSTYRSIVLSPSFIYGQYNLLVDLKTDGSFRENSSPQRRGFGLEGSHKWYLNKIKKIDDIHFPYLAAGLSVTGTRFSYNGVYIQPDDSEIQLADKVNYLTLLPQLVMGNQIQVSSLLVVDIYAGFGYRLVRTVGIVPERIVYDFEEAIISPLKKGIRLTAGLRIGFQLGR